MPPLDVIADWGWKIGTGLLSAFAFVWARLANKDKVTNERMRDIDALIIGHQDRLSVIETKLAHLPTHQDMALIHEKINECTAVVNRLEGASQQVSHNVRLIQQHLIQKDKS